MYEVYPNLSKGNGQMIRIAAGIFVGGAIFYVMTTYLTGFSAFGIAFAGFFGLGFGSVVAFIHTSSDQDGIEAPNDIATHGSPLHKDHAGFLDRTEWFEGKF